MNLPIFYKLLKKLTTHTSVSPIRRGFTPGFVNYKVHSTRCRKFSLGTPASSTTKTGHHERAESGAKTKKNQS